MDRDEVLAAWAPGLVDPRLGETDWSRWTRPVLFVQPGGLGARSDSADLPLPDASWAPAAGDTAVVVDLPGAGSVRMGMSLARLGYRPVPLYNGCPPPRSGEGPESGRIGSSLVDPRPIMQELLARTDELLSLRLPAGAPPAFLLDSNRNPASPSRTPGRFDNRWITLPQDFPSGNLLRSRGVDRAILVTEGRSQPPSDLAHVLRRWQEAGIRLEAKDASDADRPAQLNVPKPWGFKNLGYRVFAVLGLVRNSAGGFGGLIPHPSSGGGIG